MTTGEIIIVSLTTALAIYSAYLLVQDKKKGKHSH